MIYQISTATHAVRFTTGPLSIHTLEGVVACSIGDAVITGTKGETWPVPRDAFFRKYIPMHGVAPGKDGQYQKRLAFVEARQLERTETIVLSGGRGELTGQNGDWCLTYGLGNQAFIRADIFAESYVPSKSVSLCIGVERGLLDASKTNLAEAEIALRAALPFTPIVFVPVDSDAKVRQPLWFIVAATQPAVENHAVISDVVLSLGQLVAPSGVDSLLEQIGRLHKQSTFAFTVDRFRSLVAGFFNEPGVVSEMDVIAAQLVAVNELNAAVQGHTNNEFFVATVPDALAATADDDLRRVGAVADLLAGESQKKWQQLVLADTKALVSVKSRGLVAKPFAMFGLLLGSSIAALGLLAALGLAAFSELAEGCDSSDWFAWTGCTTEGWKQWVGFSAFATYIGALVFAWWRFAVAKVRRYEGKHQDYRLLAECLRVQYVLSALGVGACVADDFAAAQNAESSWVILALRSLTSGSCHAPTNRPPDSVANHWAMNAFVEDQIRYHEATLIKRREDAIAVLSAMGRLGAVVFLMCLVLLTVNVVTKFIRHDAAIFSPMGQHILLILQVAGLALWGSMRKVIDTFALEQEVQRGLVVFAALKKASATDRQSIIAAAQLFAQDQAAWHALRRSKPVEATTGGG